MVLDLGQLLTRSRGTYTMKCVATLFEWHKHLVFYIAHFPTVFIEIKEREVYTMVLIQMFVTKAKAILGW
jgi:hypothetical protein